MKHKKSTQDLAAGFDPRMLVEDARAQAPEFTWLPAALENSGVGAWESRAYVHYISPKAPNRPDSQWQFATNVTIEHSVFGTVIIDILHGDRIGGIEFLDRIDA